MARRSRSLVPAAVAVSTKSIVSSSPCESRSRRPSTVSRTPSAAQCAASARRYSLKSRISHFTSRSGRCQLSAENAKSVSVPIPRSGAASTIRRTTSAPARCPAARERPWRVAQRPLPSMMIPTWMPAGGEAAGWPGFIGSRLPFGTAPAVPHGTDQGFHVVEVMLECLASRGAQPVFRAGEAPLEGLGAGYVPRLLELPGVDAEIAVGRLEQAFELVEGERLVHRERAHDREAHPLVDEAVEPERLLARSPSGAQAPLFGLGPPGGVDARAGTVRLSHRASAR